MNIRIATLADAHAIASIIVPTIRDGTTYALDPAMSEAEALGYWLGNDKTTFVAILDGEIIGTYYIRQNQSGGGSHVCNCGYMTSAVATGKGVAAAMCNHSLDYARQCGFRAMQFNFVVSTNVRAIDLWKRMGFEVVGTLPGAFLHKDHGFVDALVLFRML